MTELFDDTDLRVAFRDFAGATHPHVRPPGADRAQHDARGRIRTRRLVVVCAAALAVLVPAALVALAQVGGSSSMPEPPATETPVTPTAPTRSSTPTATPTMTATTPPPQQPTPGPGDLLNATLSLSWSEPYANEICGGTVTIDEGTSRAHVLSTMHLDVDRDGTNEILANIFCQVGQSGPMQLIAVEPGPPPSMIGAVLKTVDTGDGGQLVGPGDPGVAAIYNYVGFSDGSVRVEVADKLTCCDTPVDWAVRQERTYRWNGSAFAQIDGPTTFAADPSVADLAITVPTLAIGLPVDGFRAGTLSITVRNNGPQAAADVSVFAWYHGSFQEPTGGDWDQCNPKNQRYAVCAIGEIGPGQSVTLTLPLRRASGELDATITTYPGQVEVRAGDVRYPVVEFDVSFA